MAPPIGLVKSPLRERLLAKVRVNQETNCWEWTGTTNGVGYGKIWVGDGVRTSRYAHRVSFEIHVGPIPSGMQLDHLCRNRRCINPKHLEPVTNAENARRGDAGIINWKKTHCVRGHDFSEHGYNDGRGRQCRACLHIRQKKYYEQKRERANVQP